MQMQQWQQQALQVQRPTWQLAWLLTWHRWMVWLPASSCCSRCMNRGNRSHRSQHSRRGQA